MPHRKHFLFLVAFFLTIIDNLCATHNGNRYFPFFEKPEDYGYHDKQVLDTSFFMTFASTAFSRTRSTVGIPELWGQYDLNAIITSYQAAGDPGFVNPFIAKYGPGFDLVSAPFKVSQRIRSRGVTFSYKYPYKISDEHHLLFGFWMPVIHLDTTCRYQFLSEKFQEQSLPRALTDKEQADLNVTMDKIRRQTHDLIGFNQNAWQKGGLGDLDLFAMYNFYTDHKLLMRSINVNGRLGLIVPTGGFADNDVPTSIPFMGNGHWGLYFDFVPEFELKQDVKVGLMVGFLGQFRKTMVRRIAVYQEPDIFSSLVGDIQVDPGFTFKISPYLILENLTDGLSVQGRYTYLRYGQDEFHDVRKDKIVPSYLSRTPAVDITQEAINANIADKENKTRRRSHYVTLQFLYDAKKALQNWSLDPTIYVAYDIPVGGSAICKTHQVSCGVELHF